MSALEKLGVKILALQTKRTYSKTQLQTKDVFAFKWSKRDTYESEAIKRNARRWLFERYCENKPSRLKNWLSGSRKIILDAGCGSGYSALCFFGNHLKKHDYLGVDISSAVEVGKQRFAESGLPGDFLQANLLEIPIPDKSVDMIFSEGVLHHTDSTKQSLTALVKKLKKGGRFLFYVYAQKAVIREFSDDHIRVQLRPMTDEEAWRALEPLTKLGIALGKLNVDITVPDDIPYLGIKKGKINLQRFFYWNICKMYYRPEYTLDEMNHINFDWFRPLNCHRHTPEEIECYCKEAKLTIEYMNIQEAGITVVAVKR
jgi:arsenite methyltransferase